jgi:hypothetical protein
MSFFLFLDLPEWNFDGSSTGQAEGSNSDVLEASGHLQGSKPKR